MATKTKTAKTNGAKTNGASNGHKSEVRSANQGGHVAAERYAKDPKSVVTRLKEKAQAAATQAANAIVRAEAAEVKGPHVEKLKKALDGFEKVMKTLG